MSTTSHQDDKIAKMTFASVFPHYKVKIEKKGRTMAELFAIIEWLTGFSEKEINDLIKDKITFEDFFLKATLHPNAVFIAGTICGYRIDEIENALTKKVRYLDKIVDELAKGVSIEKIMRSTK